MTDLYFEGVKLVFDTDAESMHSLVCKSCGTVAKNTIGREGAMRVWCAWCNKMRDHGWVALRRSKLDEVKA